ncbi:hypothetical protein [Sulfurospirillum multivorans]|uniref:Uncharacterized protein n=2 Tax=Sulfurospirillum multivorans TaxID=66821 RepID=A0AA86AM90_SULMK|nr:hypothetical protein [Sulfurospirillum multivorans]AHJ13034.1 hypothetical protein SMUL_1779 [Sulfurospirillum multivorans DSM 12446]QEH06525.1 hypothetical protein SMN_1760 [Sulfurospirillum multivorans]
MIKKRGNPNLNQHAHEKKENTISLIRQAILLLEENFEIKTIQAVSAKTKEIDPRKKGVSEAAFRNKELEHIQSLMIELRIGKYESLSVTSTELEIAEQLFQVKKEIKKKDEELQKIKDQKKKLSRKIETLTIENEELRVVIYEIEMKAKMKKNIQFENNINLLK